MKKTQRKIVKHKKHSHAIVKRQVAIRVQPPSTQPWELNREQVAILKNYLRMGCASDAELAGCLEVARRYRIDPFKQGQIWFIKRWDKHADNGKGGIGAYIWVAQLGIYGMAGIAARDHKDYGSLSQPQYGPMTDVVREGHKIKAPQWCIIRAFKKGQIEPSVGEVFFDEICPQSWENCRLFWAVMPHRMIAKCAKAQALREAYPDLGGLYIPEEMGRFRDEVTPEGRQIVRAEPPLSAPPIELKDAPQPPADAALLYVWDEGKQLGYITGHTQLLTENKKLLLFKGKWSKEDNAIVVDAATLEDLKYQFEQRSVPFKPLKSASSVPAHDWKKKKDAIADAAPPREPGQEG